MAIHLKLSFFLLLIFLPTQYYSFRLPSFLHFPKKSSEPLPIDTQFKLPSPLPTWPEGEGFATGTIDLGGLQVVEITSFSKIWATHEGGPDNLGASFFEPASLPDGFFSLGCYAQPNNKALFGWVLAGKDVAGGALKPPVDYTLVWSSESSKIKQDGNGYIWLPTPPEGYSAVGHVITASSEKPPLDKVRVVRSDLTDGCGSDLWIWGHGNDINFYTLRPNSRGVQAQGVSAGTFLAQNGGDNLTSLACLKNKKSNFSSMPNLSQIQALVQVYSPWIYFHPDEQYLPSSVSWFFKNGALLYRKDDVSKPEPIEITGSNLPQGGSDDGAYWLDLPADQSAKEQMKKGSLQDAGAYLHIKPMLGGTFTAMAIWVFYPFNGASKAKVEFLDVPLGKIGEHIGDWEHVTMRVSNFNGELKSVYFSQHSGGMWVSASDLEYQGGNKPVTYSALHSHAMCPKAGLVIIGDGGVGIRMDAGKGQAAMDAGVRFLAVAVDHLGSSVVEPPWLNYARGWGPKIDYDIESETENVEKVLPGSLKGKFQRLITSLPKELLGEQGPTGPKMKDNWSGDERL